MWNVILPPDAPKVSMPSTSPGYYLQKGELTCQVDSLIPFTLRFSREGKSLGVDQIFRCFLLHSDTIRIDKYQS